VSKRFKFEDYESVWKHSQSQGNDLLLLLALVKFRQPAGMYATKETLALLMRCTVDTVDRSLKRLRECGELSWDKGSSHSKRANRYQILLPGLDFDPNNTPLISPRNSQEIPPDSAVEYPRKFTPLNSNETEIKVKEEILVFECVQFGVLHLRSCDVSGLAPLQVWGLMQVFDSSFESRSAYTEKVRLDRWWAYLSKAASQAEGEN
jgi:hypothetical protein